MRRHRKPIRYQCDTVGLRFRTAASSAGFLSWMPGSVSPRPARHMHDDDRIVVWLAE